MAPEMVILILEPVLASTSALRAMSVAMMSALCASMTIGMLPF